MASELKIFLTGGAANADPDASLGGVTSSVEVDLVIPMNNLFDDIEHDDAVAGIIQYRAIAIKNVGDAKAGSITLWAEAATLSPDTAINFGIDSGVQTIANDTTAPTAPAISFATHISRVNELAIADLNEGVGGDGDECRIWIRRTCSALATNYAEDKVELSLRYA